MQKSRIQKPETRNQTAARPRAALRFIFCFLLSALCLLLFSCDDTSHLTVAIEALKSRERKVVARESGSKEREQQFAEKERQLAATAALLEKQRAEVDALKQKLLDEIAQTRLQQEMLLQREKRGPAPIVSAQRVVVIDPDSGEIFAEKNADRRAPVASTQKLLTALIIVETGNLDGLVTITKEDSQCAPVKIGMSAGEQYSRRQLLTALMVRSYNDIARALARDNAGSLEGFARKMNARAKLLGMKNSHFINPNGLPADGQYSTARDMAIAAKAADAMKDIRDMVSTRSFAFKRPGGRYDILENTNRVLRTCEFCDGMKTGYTDAAGYCLVASGEREGRRRIVVVLTDTRDAVWKDTEALLEWSLRG